MSTGTAARPDGLGGFRRRNGSVGVRNHVLVMPVRSAANVAASRIADGVAGAVAVAQESERPDAFDTERIRRTLIGFCSNPNVGAVLVVGVTAHDAWLADALRDRGQEVMFVALAEHRGTANTTDVGRTIAGGLRESVLADRRVEISPADLVLGLECGGSDALSGITANPALGVASDMLVAAGGTSLLAETPELIGAEEALAARAVSPEVARRVREVILGFEGAVRDLGVDVRGAQPTPGNQAGGLTTIEEKALGSAKKGGNAPVSGVVDIGERPRSTGLHIMDTPGHDIEQMVGMVAGGAQVVAFTTGRGTPTGSPIAPCVKISTNTAIFERLAGDIDIDAGAILGGTETVASMGALIYARILAVAGGELTASERHHNREFALSYVTYSA